MRPRPPASMSISLPDGKVLDMSVERPADGEQVTVQVLEVLQPRLFDRCPICGDPATSEEHVPAESLHGRVMTRTCEPCNNGLGSRVEPALLDWYDNAITLSKLSGGDVPGQRHAGRFLVHHLPGGQFVLLQDGRYDPVIADILSSGQVDLQGALPDPDHVRLALLKNAYLAACVKFGIPDGEYAEQTRAELIAARDAKRRQDIPPSAIARGLVFRRLSGPVPTGAASLAMAVAHESAGPVLGAVLAGRIFVSWTTDLGAQAQDPTAGAISVPLIVGTAVSGVITPIDTL